MKKISSSILFLMFLFVSRAQTVKEDYKRMLDSLQEKSEIPQITVDELKKKPSAYLLDVREEREYNISHLKKARHVGYIWFDMRTVYDIPLDANIVLYCSSGERSNKIAGKLVRYGYQHVYSLYGGVFKWVNEGNPVYRSNGVQTSEIHVFSPEYSKWITAGTKVY
ncbi:MAG: rhodanese-like domain-containing protein [Sphingobacteriaceae bacterium]